MPFHSASINEIYNIDKIPFCLPCGKADDTPSPTLPRVRSSLLRLHPWTPFADPVVGGIWGILDFRSIGVKGSDFAVLIQA